MTEPTKKPVLAVGNVSGLQTRMARAGDLKITIHPSLMTKLSSHLDNKIQSQVSLGLNWGEMLYADLEQWLAMLNEQDTDGSTRAILIRCLQRNSSKELEIAVSDQQ